MKTYQAEADAAGTAVAAAVAAFSTAFGRIASDFVADLGAVS
jgi:ABC-type uncharacterized transport system auxiliary subunit